MYDRFQSLAQKTRLKIPLIYGIDAVHGHNNVQGRLFSPTTLGLVARLILEIVYKVADITAREVAAMESTGILLHVLQSAR